MNLLTYYTQLKLIHWNCFSFRNKRQEFDLFLQREIPEIVVLNELKLLPEEANHYLSFSGYASMFKQRSKNPKRGGGVAILVKKDLNYEQVSSFDSFNKELVKSFPE